MNLAVRCLCAVVAIAAAGCGRSNVLPLVTVSGSVSYDGNPVADGSVMFVAPDGSTVPVVLTVTDGRYEGRVVAGKKRIEVRGMRRSKNATATTGGPGADEAGVLENYIPPTYNDASTIVRSIDVPGPQTIDLDLAPVR
jgi:hypothetical protein